LATEDLRDDAPAENRALSPCERRVLMYMLRARVGVGVRETRRAAPTVRMVGREKFVASSGKMLEYLSGGRGKSWSWAEE